MMYCKNAEILRNRFGLSNGQFYATYVYKNLWWEFNGDFFGFGDITADQVFHIQNRLDKGDVFQGWNEHHRTEWQQTDVPMIRIKKNDIMMHGDLINEATEQNMLRNAD